MTALYYVLISWVLLAIYTASSPITINQHGSFRRCLDHQSGYGLRLVELAGTTPPALVIWKDRSMAATASNVNPRRGARLQRRDKRIKYSNEVLREVGFTDEQIARFEKGRAAQTEWENALDANRKARKSHAKPPFSRERTRELYAQVADYKKLTKLVTARLSGDALAIEKAEQAVNAGHQARGYTDDELK